MIKNVMKNAVFLVIISALLPPVFANENNTVSQLKDLRWQSRIVITSATANSVSTVIDVLDENEQALNERRLVVFIVSENQIIQWQGEQLKSSLILDINKTLNRKHTLLIGLDGGLKHIYDNLDLRDIFRDIDGMPMRRAEMKK